jgi:putative ABC transport system ATP-binding protein
MSTTRTTDVLVSARRVAKSFPGSGGLAPTDVELVAGRLTVVRGRSGSGKSTLLAVLAGWAEPDTGLIERHPTASVGRWSGTAIVPQAQGLAPELTSRENVELPLRLAGGDVDRDMVGELLRRLDLDELADRRPGEISLGQRQRVALARALVADPAVILVDEPTSHQDGGHADTVIAALRRAASRGAAVLVATHDPAVIAAAHDIVDLDAPRPG